MIDTLPLASTAQYPTANLRSFCRGIQRLVKAIYDGRIVVPLALFVCASTCVRADALPQLFPTSPQVAQEIVSATCNAPYSAVVVLKNSAGLIGGYVRMPLIMDSPIPYLDSNGKLLAMFHIFSSMDEKKKASSVIDQLRSQFPVEQRLDCANQPR